MSEVVKQEAVDARERAVTALRAGSLVVLPTDSVYGVAADAFSSVATQRLIGAKRRGRNVPLPILIRSPRQTTGLVAELGEPAERLMASYWPGPLTLVFPAVEDLGWDIGDNFGTVALRMPTDDFLLELIAEVGPLAVTAANRRGEPVPTTVEAARSQLGVSVALYVDGGERSGPTSTIVDVTHPQVDVLAEGAIAAADVRLVASGAVAWGARPDAARTDPHGRPPRAAPRPDAVSSQ